MEKFQEFREGARKKIKVADHILTQTYPLVKDPKLLIAVIENIFLGMSYAMSSVLYHERLFKKIPPFNDNFSSKLSVFKQKCVERYGIESRYLFLLRDLKNIIVEHRKSPMEFVRNDKFVICSDSYNLRTININDLRSYVSDAKVFIEEMGNITRADEDIFV
ncbi:hypothetical protein GF351_02430 [Candidatus Woesearchaeota archaeon]|nr:hypothetical protein [Candidatus Woesearchaeota archaeon]